MNDFGTILLLLAEFPVWSEAFLHREIAALLDRDKRFRAAALRGTPSSHPPLEIISGTSEPAAAAPGRPSKLPRPLRAMGSSLRHRAARRALTDYCHRNGVQHIHAEFCDLPAELARVVARRLGISYSVGAHARDVFCCKYNLANLLKEARFATVCNGAARDALLRNGSVEDRRCHLVHHGLPLDDWPFQHTRPPGRDLRLLWAGRMVPKKGLDLLLNALALFGESHAAFGADATWSLSLFGEGCEALRLRRLAGSLRLEPHLRWHSPRCASELREAFNQADALVLPACIAPDGDRDGIPNIALEAMASGLPVVATTTGGLRDIITPETAWVAESATAEGVADALDAFADPADGTREQRSLCARRRVEADFDLETTAAVRQRLFSQALEEKL